MNLLCVLQRCCYNNFGTASFNSRSPQENRGFLDTLRRYQAGSLLQYNPFVYRSLYNDNDVLPKRWCCIDTNNCQLFYEFRPLDTCVGYRLPFFGKTLGEFPKCNQA